MTHRYPVRVYYEDTDAGGVVYHATYLRFAERARTEALRELGIPHAEMVAEHGVMFMVRRIEVDYLRPARPDDSLIVETETLAVGGATANLRQTVIGPDGACAVLLVRLACVQLGGNKPGRIPPRWRSKLEPDAFAHAHASNSNSKFDRVIQTSGDSASGHHAPAAVGNPTRPTDGSLGGGSDS